MEENYVKLEQLKTFKWSDLHGKKGEVFVGVDEAKEGFKITRCETVVFHADDGCAYLVDQKFEEGEQ